MWWNSFIFSTHLIDMIGLNIRKNPLDFIQGANRPWTQCDKVLKNNTMIFKVLILQAYLNWGPIGLHETFVRLSTYLYYTHTRPNVNFYNKNEYNKKAVPCANRERPMDVDKPRRTNLTTLTEIITPPRLFANKRKRGFYYEKSSTLYPCLYGWAG